MSKLDLLQSDQIIGVNKSLDCVPCQYKFVRKKDLDDHLKNYHTKLLPIDKLFGANFTLDCSPCQFKFVRKKDLDDHFNENHRKIRKIVKNPSFKRMPQSKRRTYSHIVTVDSDSSDEVAVISNNNPRTRKKSVLINEYNLEF